MKSETIDIIIAIISFLYFSLLSTIKVVFKNAEQYETTVKNPATYYLVGKVQDILQDKIFLYSLVSIAKIVSSSLLVISLYNIYTIHIEGHLLVATYTVLSVLFLLSIFAYTIPKSIATSNTERYLPFVYYFYKFNMILAPLASLMSFIHKKILKAQGFDEKFAFLTSEEKERLSEDDESTESLDNDERAMIRNILEFDETIVKEVMVPRTDVTALNIDADFNKVLQVILDEGHSRIPIFKETIDTVVGILYAKDILSWISKFSESINIDEWKLENVIKEPYFVPANKKLDDLMTEMKKNHTHIVIVVDEYGGTAGICTMEDILEEIVGEINDEYDDKENDDFVELSPNVYLIDAHMELDDIADKIKLNFDFEESEYNTIGGLFYHEYGDVPTAGTTFQFHGYTFKIVEMSNQRIEKIELTIPDNTEIASELDGSF